ncbi:hypothetical protein D0962_05615 [Leptolyngbyaceae cyanobacterium CCMR0082]|uniref:Uncharacterized protein n=1 Tax=Adonisia turfae CCMR0082 TaxID=2304604 RepID=A0A6M0S1G0_9CYAN|nr:hypothetical protein [Adonisia turfae CCMR0082]
MTVAFQKDTSIMRKIVKISKFLLIKSTEYPRHYSAVRIYIFYFRALVRLSSKIPIFTALEKITLEGLR